MSCDTFPDPENGYYRGLARIHMADGSQEIFLTRGQSPQHAKKYVKIEIFGYFAHKKWICFGDYKSQFQFWIDSSFIFERLTTQAHGWTIFTATSRFNEFCQKQHIGIDEKCDSMILDRKTCRVKFSFRGTVFLSHQEGSSKKDARKLCDLDIVGQLCECGFIEKFGEKREIPSQLPMPRREAKKEKEEQIVENYQSEKSISADGDDYSNDGLRPLDSISQAGDNQPKTLFPQPNTTTTVRTRKLFGKTKPVPVDGPQMDVNNNPRPEVLDDEYNNVQDSNEEPVKFLSVTEQDLPAGKSIEYYQRRNLSEYLDFRDWILTYEIQHPEVFTSVSTLEKQIRGANFSLTTRYIGHVYLQSTDRPLVINGDWAYTERDALGLLFEVYISVLKESSLAGDEMSILQRTHVAPWLIPKVHKIKEKIKQVKNMLASATGMLAPLTLEACYNWFKQFRQNNKEEIDLVDGFSASGISEPDRLSLNETNLGLDTYIFKFNYREHQYNFSVQEPDRKTARMVCSLKALIKLKEDKLIATTT